MHLAVVVWPCGVSAGCQAEPCACALVQAQRHAELGGTAAADRGRGASHKVRGWGAWCVSKVRCSASGLHRVCVARPGHACTPGGGLNITWSAACAGFLHDVDKQGKGTGR
jgi:hypothetical protein